MEIRQLRYFVAAAEAGTISRAASRCSVSQPSLSQQILKLEAELGIDLFDRLGRGVALTDAGRALLPRARRVLSHMQEIEADLRRDLDAGRGRLAVGAIPTMAPYLVPKIIAGLRAEHPECEIHVREDLTQNLVEALADNEIDVAVMSTPIDHDLIDLQVIGREPMLVVAPSEHPLSSSGSITFPDLRTLPAVTLHEMHCLGRQIDDFCTSRRLASNVVCRMTQIDTLLEFVRLGLGVSIVPAMVAAHDAGRGRVYLRFARPPEREIALAWRSGRTRPGLAIRFARLLEAELAGAGRPPPVA